MTQTPVVPPTPRPVRERGYAAEPDMFADPLNETTPELMWPLSIFVYDRMRSQDAQVGSVLRAAKTPILRTQWWIDGAGCRPEVTEFVADNLRLPIYGTSLEEHRLALTRGRDRFSWTEHVRLSLLQLEFGHSYFEQVYRYDERTDQYRLRKLGPRLPRTISKVNVARDGGLVSIEQYGSAMDTRGGVTLPVNRLVAYVQEREGGNWLGRSLLRSAYKNWLLKDKALRTWFTSIDRNGVGIPVATAAENSDSDRMDDLEDIATSIRSGDDSGAVLAAGDTIELLGMKGELPDAEKFVTYNDAQIARSALGHFLNLGGQTNGQVGSYNLGSVFADTFHLSLDAVAGHIAETADAHVIEDLVDINFGPTEPAPRLVYDPIGTRQTELDRAREAAGLTSDANLVRFLREHQEAA